MHETQKEIVNDFLRSLDLGFSEVEGDFVSLNLEGAGTFFIEGTNDGLVVSLATTTHNAEINERIVKGLINLNPERQTLPVQLGLLGQRALVFSVHLDEFETDIPSLKEAMDTTLALARETWDMT